MGYFEEQGQNMQNGNIMPDALPVPVDASETVMETASVNPDQFDALCREYKSTGGKGYIVSVNLSQDDDMDAQCQFLFKEPKPASYDRYVKTASVSSTKAMRTFVLDNVHEAQKKDLEAKLIEYPAMGISLGEKLLYMLGLSKTTTVKRL